MIIRPETEEDHPSITIATKEAFTKEFGKAPEVELIEALRKNDKFVPELSLVALLEGKVVGHILFFPITITNKKGETFNTLSLAPISVLPEYQNKGIGSALIKEGLKQCKSLGFNSVIVVGHPEYYPKLGFTKASSWNIKAPFEIPDEAFMAIEITEGELKDAGGIIQFPEEYSICL